MRATDWAGNTVICSKCKSKNIKYLYDEDHDSHDDPSCEVFQCQNCGKLIHIELPDDRSH